MRDVSSRIFRIYTGKNGRRNGGMGVKGKLVLLILLLSLAACARNPEPPAAPAAVTEQPPETTTQAAPEMTEPPTEPPTEPQTQSPEAEPITAGITFTVAGAGPVSLLDDGAYETLVSCSPERPILIDCEIPFAALVIKWEQVPPEGTLFWAGGEEKIGGGFLHEAVILPQGVSTALLKPSGEASICEIALFTEGKLPRQAQQWLPPCETADLLVFPTHADDDVLFFGAAMSTYALDRGLEVQTAFMTEHYDEPVRKHERLDGLWELGLRRYPVVGTARDFYTKQLKEAEYFHRDDGILAWQVEQIRRFRPLVILGHDLNGEYGHGQHKLNAHCLTQAVEAAGDPEQFPDSAGRFGVWDTPKLYLHLYQEGEIVLDVNTPLLQDDQGRTPFEMAQSAYSLHKSQAYTWFRVQQGEGYGGLDCRRFGLYRSLVGSDTAADLLENIDETLWRASEK